MDENVFDKLDQYVLSLASVCKIKEVYLFGSTTSSENTENSDLDLAIVSDIFNADNYIDYMTQFILLSSGYGLDIEPHLFNDAEALDDFFRNEVLAKGVCLYPTAA